MSQLNGTAGRRRVRAIPKTVVFEIEVLRNGKEEILELTGHHRECPSAFVVVQQEVARQEYLDNAYVDVEVDDGNGGTKTESQFVYSHENEVRYRRDTLMAVLPGLEEQDANVLARDGGPWLELLRDLGWWRQADEAEATDDPEATGGAGEAPTMAPSSPDSPPSMAPTTGSA